MAGCRCSSIPFSGLCVVAVLVAVFPANVDMVSSLGGIPGLRTRALRTSPSPAVETPE
jgi:hypothetical protein